MTDFIEDLQNKIEKVNILNLHPYDIIIIHVDLNKFPNTIAKQIKDNIVESMGNYVDNKVIVVDKKINAEFEVLKVKQD